jgi:hypothetical protein
LKRQLRHATTLAAENSYGLESLNVEHQLGAIEDAAG